MSQSLFVTQCRDLVIVARPRCGLIDIVRAFVYNVYMTLPDERYRAVRRAESLLKDLCDASKTPKIPKTIRGQAASILRHYPCGWDMDVAAHCTPSVFESPNKLDDLQVFIQTGIDKRAS